MDGARARARGRDFERRALLAQELSGRLYDEAFFFPIEIGGDELIDVKIAAAMEKDGVRKFGQRRESSTEVVQARGASGTLPPPLSFHCAAIE